MQAHRDSRKQRSHPWANENSDQVRELFLEYFIFTNDRFCVKTPFFQSKVPWSKVHFSKTFWWKVQGDPREWISRIKPYQTPMPVSTMNEFTNFEISKLKFIFNSGGPEIDSRSIERRVNSRTYSSFKTGNFMSGAGTRNVLNRFLFFIIIIFSTQKL